MQLTDPKTRFLTSFIRFFASTTLKTFILDRFLSENAIKLMLFHYFEFGGGKNTVKQMVSATLVSGQRTTLIEI